MALQFDVTTAEGVEVAAAYGRIISAKAEKSPDPATGEDVEFIAFEFAIFRDQTARAAGHPPLRVPAAEGMRVMQSVSDPVGDKSLFALGYEIVRPLLEARGFTGITDV